MKYSQYHPVLRRLLPFVLSTPLLSVISMAGTVTDSEVRLLDLDAIMSLKANVVEADISVMTHEANTAKLLIHRKVKDLPENESARVMDQIKTRFETDGDTLVLQSDLPKNNKEWKKATGIKRVNFELKYELTIPARLNIYLKAVDGDLLVENVAGECRLNTVDGDILVTGSGSSVKANSVDGDIQIKASKGSIRANTVDGDIIAIGTSSIIANTTDGDIVAQFTDQPNGNNQLNTIDGDLQVALPEDAAVSITAMAQGGVVSCELPISNESRRKGQLIGTLNGGGVRIQANTIDGDISITKAKN